MRSVIFWGHAQSISERKLINFEDSDAYKTDMFAAPDDVANDTDVPTYITTIVMFVVLQE